MVQDQVGEFADLEKLIIEEKSKFNQLDLNLVTVQLAVDGNTPMKQVYDFYQILRKINLLKVAFVCYPDDNSTNLYPPTAFPHKLPPLIGAEILDSTELAAMSIKFFEIHADDKENSSITIEPELTQFISESEKYIIVLMYDNSTSYKDYMSYNDMIWSVVYKYRNQYALEKYNIKYENLEKDLQKDVRKKYPLIIPKINKDEDDYEK